MKKFKFDRRAGGFAFMWGGGFGVFLSILWSSIRDIFISTILVMWGIFLYFYANPDRNKNKGGENE